MDSSLFALCLVFSLVVMYDATGVRLHAGRQAEVLNEMIMNLPANHPVADRAAAAGFARAHARAGGRRGRRGTARGVPALLELGDAVGG